MIIDVALCHDCNICYMGCKDEHVGNDWTPYTGPQPRLGHRWINIECRERGSKGRIDVACLPLPCQHCEDAPCIKASDGAVIRREDGIVMIDMEKAKGCKDLAESCPYGAIFYNDDLDMPQKCTFCAHLLDSGELAVPRCVHNCPTGALTFITAEPEEIKAMAEAEGLEAYHPELGTNPHVLYKNLYRFTKNFITAGVLVDGDCFEGASVVLENAETGAVCTGTTNFFGEFKLDGLDDGTYMLKIDANGRKFNTEVTVQGKSVNLGNIFL